MFNPLKFNPSEFSKRLASVTEDLYSSFKIPLKEYGESVIEEMRSYNDVDYKRSGLSDPEKKLMKVLCADRDGYMKDHSRLVNGEAKPVSLFVNGISPNGSENEEIIKKYESYVKNFPDKTKYDKIFLDALNKVCKEYKSSTDYMTRLVRNLLKNEPGYDTKEPTRVLIFRRFLDVLTDDVGEACVEKFRERKAKELYDMIYDKQLGKQKIIDSALEIEIFGNCDEKTEAMALAAELAKLRATVVHKSRVIPITKEICNDVCSVIAETFEGKPVLTEKVIDGSAEFLNECFYDPSSFDIIYVKGYKDENNKAVRKSVSDLIDKLGNLYDEYKKDMMELDRFDPLFRAGVLITSFSRDIILDKATANFLNSVFFAKADANKLKETNEPLASYATFGKIKEKVNKPEKGVFQKMTEIADWVLKQENTLPDKQAYKKTIYDKLAKRYNEAIKAKKEQDNFRGKAEKELGIRRPSIKFAEIADSLANAKFSAQGATREYLYIFAIAFGMTYGGNIDPKNTTDIEKKLFHDFYADNIVNARYNNAETMVDGYGINYKNFAEVAFLWALSQNCEPRKKLEMAYTIINECKQKSGVNAEGAIEREAKKNNTIARTEDYRQLLISSKFASITDPQEFTEMLAENYDCRVQNGVTAIKNSPVKARIVCEEYAKIVHKNYKTLISMWGHNLDEDYEEDELRKLCQDSDIRDFLLECNYLKNNRCKDCENKEVDHFPYCLAYNKQCEDWYGEYIKNSDKDELDKVIKDLIVDILPKTMPDKMYSRFETSFFRLAEKCLNDKKDIREAMIKMGERVKTVFRCIVNGENPEPGRSTVLALAFIDHMLAKWIESNSDNNMHEPEFSAFFEQFVDGKPFSYQDNDIADDEYEDEFYRELLSENSSWTDIGSGVYQYIFRGANYYLKEAGFQEVNSKNLYDICLIFTAFRDNFNRLFMRVENELRFVRRRFLEIKKRNKVD